MFYGKIAKTEQKITWLSLWYKTNIKLSLWYNVFQNIKTNPLINQLNQHF